MDENNLINNIQYKTKEMEETYYTPECFECVTNKDGTKSIKFFGHVAIKIKKPKNGLTIIELPKRVIRILDLFHIAVFTKSNPDWAKFTLDDEIANEILNNLKDIFIKYYRTTSGESFGCCSRYLECSDNKKCIHPDREHARGCIYKTNLDEGRIFYGKNRT